jgi:hypothetical protein
MRSMNQQTLSHAECGRTKRPGDWSCHRWEMFDNESGDRTCGERFPAERMTGGAANMGSAFVFTTETKQWADGAGGCIVTQDAMGWCRLRGQIHGNLFQERPHNACC